MLYFAYGSNMDWAQMQERCPSAQFVAVACLADHKLAFTRRSTTRGCGVADCVVEVGASVWGAVFDIPEVEFARLDRSEGCHLGRPATENSYNREQRHVWRDGDKEQPLLVWTYFGNPQPAPPSPNEEYKALIVNGARWWHLPDNYVSELEQIETQG